MVAVPCISQVAIRKASQTGGSEILLTLGMWSISTGFGSVLIYLPTTSLAKIVFERLLAATRSIKHLGDMISRVVSNSSGGFCHAIFFVNGLSVEVLSLGSPSANRSRAARLVIADDIDGLRFTDVDILSLVANRAKTFPDSVTVLCTSPEIDEKSPIQAAFLSGDQRVYKITCPFCSSSFPFEWKTVRWPPGLPQQAYIHAPCCGAAIPEGKRVAAVAAGRWEPTASPTNTASFSVPEFLAPWGRLGSLAGDFVKASADPKRLRVFITNRLGEPWVESQSRTTPASWELLFSRRADFAIPDDMFISCGIDVQLNKLVCVSVGYSAVGGVEQFFIIDHREFAGDTSSMDPWAALDEYLKTAFLTTASGHEIGIVGVAIDSGFRSNRVLEFVRPRQRRTVLGWHRQFVMAVRGSLSDSDPVFTGRKQTGSKIACPIFVMGSMEARRCWIDRGNITDQAADGYVHFSNSLSERFFMEFTAVRIVMRPGRSGRTVCALQELYSAHDALDACCMAELAKQTTNPNFDRIAASRAAQSALREAQFDQAVNV